MTVSLLEAFAAALRTRAATAATEAELHRAAILLVDHQHCRTPGQPPPRPTEWPPSALERAADAAWSARWTDRDDVHWSSLTHPGSIVWPIVDEVGAAVGTPGPRRLAAALTGYAALTSLALALGTDHAAVFHATATAGTVAAAATVAALLSLPDDRWTHALGHALSVVGGSRGAMIEGSGTRCFHSAHAVRTGVSSTLAAARGLDATRGDLDRRSGALAALDPDRLLEGSANSLTETSLRVFPTSGWNQTAYEAAVRAAEPAQGRIERIEVDAPGPPPAGLADAVLDAIGAIGRWPRGELPEPVIMTESITRGARVRITAAERSGEAAINQPLDHPERPASIDDLGRWKWQRSAAEVDDDLARAIQVLTEPDKERA